MKSVSGSARYRAFTRRDLPTLGARFAIPADELAAMRVVAAVYPFRANSYVVEELIDWPRVPDDPLYRLVFPQRGMLASEEFDQLAALIHAGAEPTVVEAEARAIRSAHNPQPGDQVTLNRAHGTQGVLHGVQHKYCETILYFPAAGQRCHAYCTYCFRWAQFVDGASQRFAEREADPVVAYLREHPEVSDVIVTGGDPMVMSAAELERCIRPLLDDDLSVRTIRIGTKAPLYWPFRFLTDDDSDETLRVFESVVRSGRTLAVMLHQSHPRELEIDAAARALDRIRATGAVVYTQAPMLRTINDSAQVWRTMLHQQLALGCVPYYAFVGRDTGPNRYFELPLARAYEIFRAVYASLPGLARTIRGPVMSTSPGKVVIDGVPEVDGRRYFALRFLQARDPALVGRPFHARFDPDATWFSQLDIVGDPFPGAVLDDDSVLNDPTGGRWADDEWIAADAVPSL